MQKSVESARNADSIEHLNMCVCVYVCVYVNIGQISI